MKKVLALLLVCLLATSVAFAAVQFSGSLTAGAAVNYNPDSKEWKVYTYGDDGDDSDEMSLSFTIGDDEGLWSAEVKGLWGGQFWKIDEDNPNGSFNNPELLFGESGKIEAIFKTNIAKAIATAVGGESPIDVTLEIGGNRRVTALRAYANKSGANLDRVRTLDGISPFGATIGYQDFVQANVMYSPEWWDDRNSLDIAYGTDLAASILVKPYAGIAASFDYAMVGESKAKLVGVSAADAGGSIAGAVDVNVGKLAGLDFDLGVSVSDRYEMGTKFNQLAAVVYGGIDMVSGYVEYALRTVDSYTGNYLNVGVDLALVENMNFNLYFGADDLGNDNFQHSYFVGGNIGYTLSGVTYNLGIEYNEGNIGAYNYDHEGLMIVPSVSVSF